MVIQWQAASQALTKQHLGYTTSRSRKQILGRLLRAPDMSLDISS